eukprot:TRINITY_DN23569_c0_g3_i2.p3 TRINITY_DN23569_c0_g3~~TRINITY_DN23569_c0_g3_i2.p3  ORF type:complete len:109 (+),score=28.72 TRINITY_DN23569_c0_g3_i2:82-408(+)
MACPVTQCVMRAGSSELADFIDQNQLDRAATARILAASHATAMSIVKKLGKIKGGDPSRIRTTHLTRVSLAQKGQVDPKQAQRFAAKHGLSAQVLSMPRSEQEEGVGP